MSEKNAKRSSGSAGLAMALCMLGLLAVALAFLLPGKAAAQDSGAEVRVPALWQIAPRLEKPDLSKLLTIRFLTQSDYPPFNFIDKYGRLVGFNVDLARAICEELEIECVVRTRNWEKLIGELEGGRGDAIIASMAVTSEAPAKLDFSDRNYVTPARFVVRRDTGYGDMAPAGLAGRSIGVIAKTAHEAYLRQFFPESRIVTFETREETRAALRDRLVEAVFDDAIALSFWLSGTGSENCCAFRGGAYYDPRYFGEGAAIAVIKGNDDLRRALNYALRRVYKSGKYEEIFLRYFPLGYF
jgi:polar amino acid transport system substrate-binding protein